ncbi:VENN motif pre-toxin domain-containing protein [Neisseria yangbaofengii]|uniref:VENN motif pre-toxin domain-containing protein n=2 Tax=Neisseria yangbaofengii TaxID=2709396 RepID=UPI003BA17149
MQSEIDLQRKVSQEFSKNVQEARTEINRKAEGYKALAKAAEDKAAQALQNGDLNAYREAVQTANEHHQKADNWQKGGVALAAVATGLSAPTDSALGIAAATASPAAAYQIGQYFKELAQQNSDGKLTGKQETAHILAHAVLGAATAAAGDNNALAGTISAGSAEAAAPLIGNYLYGEKDGSKLTAEQKETVTAITNLLGTATGAAVGNSTANAVQGSLNADSAVGNNHLSYKQAVNYDKELKSCSQSTSPEQCRNQVKQRYALLSDKNLAYAISVCSDASQSSKCSELRKQNESDAVKLKQDYLVDKIDLNPTWDKIIGFSEADLVLQSISLESAAKYWLQTGNSKPLAQWMSDQGYTLISGIHPKFVKLPKGKKEGAASEIVKDEKNYNTTKKNNQEIGYSTIDREMARRNKPPKKYYYHVEYNGKSSISDGVFITDPIGMERHKPITAPKGKSIFKNDIDAEKTALDAARYATKHNLWKDGKAKVYANNIVGYVNGNPTKVINVYKGKPNKEGLSPIHASPGTER